MKSVLKQLRELPDLAVEAFTTWNCPNPGDRTEHTRKPKAGSKPPTDLAVYDALRPDEKGLLFELTQAVRAVWEDHGGELTNPTTWAGETAWLVDRTHLWQHDQFLGAYVTDQVALVYRELARLCRVEQQLPMVCTRLGCGERAHLQPGGRYLVCEGGHTLDVEAERGRWLAGQDWTITETHAALKMYRGIDVPIGSLKGWAARRKIEPVNETKPLRYNFHAVCRFLNERVSQAS